MKDGAAVRTPHSKETHEATRVHVHRRHAGHWPGPGAIAQPGQPDEERARRAGRSRGRRHGQRQHETDIAGIKEALALGTEKAVNSLSKTNGYFGNQAVKILMPSSIQKVADVARMAGYQQQVDEFVLEHEPRRRGRRAAGRDTSATRSAR